MKMCGYQPAKRQEESCARAVDASVALLVGKAISTAKINFHADIREQFRNVMSLPNH